MAQTKPEYEPVPEYRKMALELIKKYPDMLDGVDASVITCVAITNKDPKDGDKEKYEIRPVPYPLRLDNPYDFYVVVYQKDWEEMDQPHKAALVMKTLCRISPEGDGKVLPYDLKDNSILVRTLGQDYLEKPNIPDILTDTVTWKKE